MIIFTIRNKIMKKIFTTSLFSLLLINFSIAQNWVSTTPENKNVIFEDFTGIGCGYCPDGHKIIDGVKEANPNDVYIIKIHAGGYANGQTPNLTTVEGNAINSVAVPQGSYPSGSANRTKNPWSETRSLWSASSYNVLMQSSPVNVYVKSFFNRSNRELTTEVEVYYTESVSDNNKLNVVLTQSNILGKQNGASQYYPENMVGDNYKHNNILRDFITPGGAWGEVISETDKGDYTYKKYVTTLPESINNVPVVFYNLSVVAFISGSNNANILSGSGCEVEYDPTGALDLSMVNKTPPSSGLCVDPFKPSIEVNNPSNETINSFNLTATINGVTTTKTFNNKISPGGKTTIEYDQLITPRGDYSVSINGFNNINGGDLFDIDASNDAVEVSGIGFQKKAFTYNKFGLNGAGENDLGRWVKTNPRFIYRPSVGKDGGAMLYYLHESWNISGKPGDILIGEADFTSITDPLISYYYAYTDGGQNGSPPTIDVKVSDNCGVSFQSLKLTECQSTGEVDDPARLWAPTSDDYRQVNVDLSEYAGKTVLISVAGIPGSSGNSLYIDEIEVGSASKIASVDNIDIQGLSVYPNPANSSINISIESKENAKATLISLQGNVINEFDIINGSATFNTSDISEGIYIINVKSISATSAIKVNIKH